MADSGRCCSWTRTSALWCACSLSGGGGGGLRLDHYRFLSHDVMCDASKNATHRKYHGGQNDYIMDSDIILSCDVNVM